VNHRRDVPARLTNARVQQASNTAAEFFFVMPCDLDKISDSQHACFRPDQ
jgi:hypothetical protein